MSLGEMQFQTEFEEMGYTVLRNGWPDFLIMRDGVIAGVEIKGEGDSVKSNQRQMMDVLSAAGVRCFVHRWHKKEVFNYTDYEWEPRANIRWDGRHEITNYMEMAGREDDVLKVINERYMRKLRGVLTRLETTRETVNGFRYLNIRISQRSAWWQRRIDAIVERLDLIIKDIETPPTRMLEQWFEV